MTRFSYIITILLGLLSPALNAQIISVLENTEELPGNNDNGIISDIDDPNAPLQGQFLDWGTVLGNFSEEVTITQEEVLEKIEQIQQTNPVPSRENHVTLDGRTLNLPTSIDENGIDLYMLTDEGITIYMALLAPSYYQETTPDMMKWIRYYAYDKRKRTQTLFNRYEKWEQYIKKVFESKGVPPELSELCLIESGCTYKALSPAGAKGMWQIMPATGRYWGMLINDEVDQREDPFKSIDVASKIFAKTYTQIGNWTLCAAAYNCGTGRVQKLVKTYGTKDWLALKQKFPQETQQYIPALLAIHYVWEYRRQLGFN